MKFRLATICVLSVLITPALFSQQYTPGAPTGVTPPSMEAFVASGSDAVPAAAGTTVPLSYHNPNTQTAFNWQFPRNYGSFINLNMMQRFTLPNTQAFLDSVTVGIIDISQGAVRFRVYGDTIIDFPTASYRFPSLWKVYDDVVIDKSQLRMNAMNTIRFNGKIVPKQFFVSVEFTVAGGNNNIVAVRGDSHQKPRRSLNDSRVVMVNQVGGDVQLTLLDSTLVESTSQLPIYSNLFMIAYVDTATSSPLPVFTSTPMTKGYTEQPYRYQAQAAGVPRPQYTLVRGPNGMTVDQVTGVVSWSPFNSNLGDHQVTIRATNDNGSAEQSYTLTVVTSTAPKITSLPVRTAIVNEPYFYRVTATGGPEPVFTLTAGPTGMTMDRATGQLVFTPTSGQVGTFIIGVTATNPLGTDTQSWILTVDATAVAPKINSTAKTTATVGQEYKYDVVASGNPSPTFSLPTAPTGMTINATTGSIAWTPGTAGQFNVVIRASNRAGTDDQSYTLTIDEAGSGPVFTSTPVTTAIAGQTYSYRAAASGSPAPTFSLKVAPQGMQVDGVSGQITWTPAREDKGTYSITVTATNTSGSTDQTFVLQVQASPRITSDAVFTAEVSKLYRYQVVVDAEPQPTWSLVQAPTGMTVSASGLIEWTPIATQVGQHTVRVRATNPIGEDTQQFTIDVTNTTSAEDAARLAGYLLSSAYPNPLSLGTAPVASFSATLPVAASLRIEVRDALGRLVSVLADTRVAPGTHSYSVDAAAIGIGTGVYFIRMQAGDIVLHRALTVVR